MKKDTCCNSYQCRNADNSNYEFAVIGALNPTLNTEVYCDATNCVFERGQKCHADRIEIKNVNGELKLGIKDAQNVDVTNCQTFESKD